MAIDERTTPLELAARVSAALERAGIKATLSGGGAVGVHTRNRYASLDLDFVTSARRRDLASALASLGFVADRGSRYFAHPRTRLVLEFPAGPLAFGNRTVHPDEIPALKTRWGPLRVVTPTLCVMDRLAAFWHWHDRQAWDQAVMVAAERRIDFREVAAFTREEGGDPADVERLRKEARIGRARNRR